MEIQKINVKQSAISVASVFAVYSALAAIIGVILLLFGVEVNVTYDFIVNVSTEDLSMKIFLLIVMPLFTFIATFLFTSIFACIYNFTSKYTGGVCILIKDSN
jgi:ABC-type multidrug transport system fused ATPase/permease subunit